MKQIELNMPLLKETSKQNAARFKKSNNSYSKRGVYARKFCRAEKKQNLYSKFNCEVN